jgi:hypothetical protein
MDPWCHLVPRWQVGSWSPHETSPPLISSRRSSGPPRRSTSHRPGRPVHFQDIYIVIYCMF